METALQNLDYNENITIILQEKYCSIMEKDSLEMFTYKHDNIVKLANYNKYPTYFPKTTASFTVEKLDYDILSKFTLSAEYNYMNLKHEPQLFRL